MISSVSNPRVKQVALWQTKAKERKKDGVFVAEGMKMWEEAPEHLLQEVYLTKDALDRLADDPKLRAKLEQAPYELVSEEVFAKMSDTCTPQGILCVLKQPSYVKEKLLSEKNPMFLLLENLQDPGNLGTIFRSGEGAGVTAVFMNSATVDVFNPKTIRSTMGSVYRVPFLYVQDLSDMVKLLRERGVCTYAAHLDGREYFQAKDLSGPVAFLIGNEGNGLSQELSKLADEYLKIPMKGQVESLNAAVAASLLMYEAYRQRG